MNARHLFQIVIAAACLGALPACTSSVLSKHTDEQMWIDYQKDLKLRRTPASVVNSDGDIGIQKLHEQLEDVPVRRILLSCPSLEAAARCYQTKLTLAFDEAFRKSQAKTSALSDQTYKKEQQAFLKDRSFENVSLEVQSFHQIMLSGMDLRAGDHMRDLNRECESASETAISSYQPFSGGSSDMPKGYFSCLNAEWNQDANHLLDETTERLGITIVTPEAKDWIRQKQIDPVYSEVARNLISKKTAENREAWNRSIEELQKTFDFSLGLTAYVKKETPALRAKYPFFAVEVALTEIYQKHKSHSRGVASE